MTVELSKAIITAAKAAAVQYTDTPIAHAPSPLAASGAHAVVTHSELCKRVQDLEGAVEELRRDRCKCSRH